MAGKRGKLAKATKSERDGRGRLSSIDTLPPEADAVVVWACEVLKERKLPQTAILIEFNERLVDLGLEPISKGAWSRYSVRKARQWRRMEEEHRVMGEIAELLDVETPDQVTLVIGEMLKLEVYRQLEGDAPTAKELGMLARVLRNSVQAQADTIDYRTKLADLNQRLAKVAEVVAAAGSTSGTTKDTLDKITSLLTTGAA